MKSWGDIKVTKSDNVRPHILGQANIPKPLHGINPRTIMGDDAWKKFRFDIVSKQPYCSACGIHTPSLDLHEDYDINYDKCTLTIRDYVPLCKKCHSFIHSGRLANLYAKQQISKDEIYAIMSHGVRICKEHKIKVFHGTYMLAAMVGVDVKDITSYAPKTRCGWESWRLIYNNKRYKGLTKLQWLAKYK